MQILVARDDALLRGRLDMPLAVVALDRNGKATLEGRGRDCNPKERGVVRIFAQHNTLAAIEHDTFGGLVCHRNTRIGIVLGSDYRRSRQLLRLVALDQNGLDRDIVTVELQFEEAADVSEIEEGVRGARRCSHHRICALTVGVALAILLQFGEDVVHLARDVVERGRCSIGIEGANLLDRVTRTELITHLREGAAVGTRLAIKAIALVERVAQKGRDLVVGMPTHVFGLFEIGTRSGFVCDLGIECRSIHNRDTRLLYSRLRASCQVHEQHCPEP